MVAREDFYPPDPGAGAFPGYAGYGSLAWKRAMLAKRLAEAHAAPTSIGGGIYDAGRNIGNVLMYQGLRDEEKKYQDARDKLFSQPPPPTPTSTIATCDFATHRAANIGGISTYRFHWVQRRPIHERIGSADSSYRARRQCG
jgi:hypothetical protein